MKRMSACLAAVQMKCRSGDVDWNLGRARSLIEKAKGGFLDGRTVICLPELFATGYGLGRLGFAKLSESVPGPTVETLSIAGRRNWCLHPRRARGEGRGRRRLRFERPDLAAGEASRKIQKDTSRGQL